MKTKFIYLSIAIISILGCSQKSKWLKPNFYKNLYTEKILDTLEFKKFQNDLVVSFLDTVYMRSLDSTAMKKYVDSTLSKVFINYNFYGQIVNNDTVIQPFNYDIRIGDEYVVRANSYDKIGMEIPAKILQTTDGDSIQIGGKQEKPILINLWFIGCRGCIQEIPDLNRIQEKYSDRINFVAMTFENKKSVLSFLKKKKFNYKHITDANDYINQIATKPYPENIFIGKDGHIKYIEGGLGESEFNGDSKVKYFESILERLLIE